jgi:two-component system, OmpR family, heavy metal sensor histidine kinase CusS
MTIRTRMTLWYAGMLLVSVVLIVVMSLDELQERRERARYSEKVMEEIVGIVLWVGVPAVLLSIGGGWWLMRRSLAPVAALTQAAERINERNLGEKLPRTGNGDELDRLTEVLNAMTARLNDSFNRIREFTLHASHELKTPLTVLCGETEMALRSESIAPAERERWVSQLDELRRLTRIVDNLTLLTKADAGLVPLAFAPVRLDQLVRDIFADAEILAEPSGIRVQLTACEPATVSGDAHRLRQLLLNLADNAVKYNETGGSILLALRSAGPSAEFTICNTGPGIPPAVLPRVFDRFFRSDPAPSGEVEGCGLGLSIAQWIVSAHRGSINIESTPSQMTTVTVRLPLAGETNVA